MSSILTVLDRLASIAQDREKLRFHQQSSNPKRNWIFFAQRYCAAAIALDDPIDTHIYPRIQLYGHAVECALKAFLIAKKQPIPRGNGGHNLINLVSIVEAQGFYVSELQAIAVVQLSSLFFRDIGSGTGYKARYPTYSLESRENIVGNFDNISKLVISLCDECEI
jgi:hypothetical protein